MDLKSIMYEDVMKRDVIKVLKKKRVQIKGSVKLPTAYSAQTAAAMSSGTAGAVATVPQEARVIESNSEYAVLEVICSCGNKMHIQCNYGNITQNQ